MAGKSLKFSTGAEAINSIANLTLVMENGEQLTFSMADETEVPEDLDQCFKYYQKAAAQQAFWQYQTERMLHTVRFFETGLAKAEGDASVRLRDKLQDERPDELIAESAVNHAAACHPEIVKLKNSLNQLRLTYGLVKSVSDAVRRRSEVLKTCVEQFARTL